MAATHVHRLGLGVGRYVAAAGVGHRIEPRRIDESYIILRAFHNGLETVGYERAGQDSKLTSTRTANWPRPPPPTPPPPSPPSSPTPPCRSRGASARPSTSASASPARRPDRTPPAGSCAPARRHPARARAAGARESVLFFYPDMPEPSRSAGHTRAAEIAFALRRLGFRTTLACETSAGYEAAAERFAADGIEVAAADRGDDLDALLRRGFDAAIVSFHTLAQRAVPALRALSPRTRIAVDSVDVHFLRMRRAAELAGDELALARAERERAQELAVYAAADVVLAVTEDERALLAGLLPGADVQVLGNVHRARRCRRAARRQARSALRRQLRARAQRRRRALALRRGHAAAPARRPRRHRSSSPARACRTIWPRSAAAAGAEPRGFLPSVEAELAVRRISIAPLRFGAGLKGKVGESLAAGVPVVATTIAAEGFDRPERGMLIADSAAGFAAAIERLSSDDELWARLSQGGRELVVGDARHGRLRGRPRADPGGPSSRGGRREQPRGHARDRRIQRRALPGRGHRELPRAGLSPTSSS